jgi:hypothetical protein
MADLDDSEIHLKRHGGRLGFSDAVQTFSSWPEEQEETFRVFENRMRSAAKSAWNTGLWLGLGFGALVLVIIIAFWGDVDTSMGIHGGPQTSDTPVKKAPAPAAPAAAPAQPGTAAQPAATPPAATAQPADQPAATPPAAAPATPK